MYLVAQRVAERFEPAVARAFLRALAQFERSINLNELALALRSGNAQWVEAAIASGGDLGHNVHVPVAIVLQPMSPGVHDPGNRIRQNRKLRLTVQRSHRFGH